MVTHHTDEFVSSLMNKANLNDEDEEVEDEEELDEDELLDEDDDPMDL